MRRCLAPFLFCTLLLSWAQAQELSTQRESYLDLISKAQNLTLQHDRLQATQILSRAIKAEKTLSPASRQLRKALSSLSEIFYTEKAQKTFELAQSTLDLHAAIDKFHEALVIEPGNTRILRAIARIRLRLGECVEAKRVIESALEMDAYSPENILLRLQALQCLEEREVLRASLAVHGDNLKSLRPGYDVLVIRDLMALKKWPEAKRKLRELEAFDKSFPESYSLLFRISVETKVPDCEMGEKYLELCQKMTESLRKKYETESSLCLSTKEIESEVKLLRSQEEKKL